MLLAAAVLPPTALLVPGVAGAGDVLAQERERALAAVRAVLGSGPERVVVVGGGGCATSSGRLVPTLAAAAVDDALLAWPPVVLGIGEGAPTLVSDVPAAVGLHLLARAGWSGQVVVCGPAGLDDGMADPCGGPPSTGVAVLAMAGLSARRGPDAPLAEDPRAGAVDDAMLADLLRLGLPGPAGDLSVSGELAEELAVSAWPVAKALHRAVTRAGAPLVAGQPWVGTPLGATYVVLVWRLADGAPG